MTAPPEPHPRTLVVGIGSPHGDDQVGWIVARELATVMTGEVEVRTLTQPAGLLDGLHDVDHLVVCDACCSGRAAGELIRWTWPDPSIVIPERSGSHDLTLPFVLALAKRLGKLPERVTLWGVELGSDSPTAPLSMAVQNAVPGIVRTIVEDLRAGMSNRESCRHA